LYAKVAKNESSIHGIVKDKEIHANFAVAHHMTKVMATMCVKSLRWKGH
jgi:hypothetical protein